MGAEKYIVGMAPANVSGSESGMINASTMPGPDNVSSPPRSFAEKVTAYVILSGLIASCSGLVFGYNIGISGISNKGVCIF